MRKLDGLLKNKKVDYNKASKFGFIKDGEKYIYKKNILDDQFEVVVIYSNTENLAKVIDLMTDEEYILADVEDSVGEFVGKVREKYEKVLYNVINKCTNTNIFKQEQTKEIIKYVKEKYNDELEFLWEKYDNNAIWRNKQNNKWYAVLLTITEDKLKIDSNKEIEIIDLRYEKGKVDDVIDNKIVFPGYHMNEQSWITIRLDYSMNTEGIIKFIDNSYNLSIGNKRK